jgi:hypothetical protein
VPERSTGPWRLDADETPRSHILYISSKLGTAEIMAPPIHCRLHPQKPPICLCDDAGKRAVYGKHQGIIRPASASNIPVPTQTLAADAVFDAPKMILIGAPLSDILRSVALLIEAHTEEAVCSIFLLDEDGQHLRFAAAPKMSDEYRVATDGVSIGRHVGSCGAAACGRISSPCGRT